MDQIENISIIQVDWDGIAATMEFGERSGKMLREQFQRTVYPALVDELEAGVSFIRSALVSGQDFKSESKQCVLSLYVIVRITVRSESIKS